MSAKERLLIALDVDGTLIHEDESVSAAVFAEVVRASELGHEVTLATGRSWDASHSILEKFNLHPEYVVCANGALVMRRDPSEPDGYRREFVETFDPAEVLNLIRPHLPEGSFMVEDATGHRLYTQGIADWDLTNANMVEFEELVAHPASRVVVVSPGHDEDSFLDIVERIGLHKVSYAIGWTAWLDIAPFGVNKATAMERVRELLNIPRTHVVAVGDGRNDIDLLTWAALHGRGVAMGQAPDEVKAVANEVTAPVSEDGLAPVLASL